MRVAELYRSSGKIDFVKKLLINEFSSDEKVVAVIDFIFAMADVPPDPTGSE